MKSYLILGCMLYSIAASAQKIDGAKVPAPVKAAFTRGFPAAGNVKWEVEKNYKGATIKETAKSQKANGEINYEAEVNGKDLIFDSKGTL
jgi:hypothetical protein